MNIELGIYIAGYEVLGRSVPRACVCSICACEHVSRVECYVCFSTTVLGLYFDLQIVRKVHRMEYGVTTRVCNTCTLINEYACRSVSTFCWKRILWKVLLIWLCLGCFEACTSLYDSLRCVFLGVSSLKQYTSLNDAVIKRCCAVCIDISSMCKLDVNM